MSSTGRTAAPDSEPRKRKLPACLGLVPGGRAQVAVQLPAAKRHAAESSGGGVRRVVARSSPSPQRSPSASPVPPPAVAAAASTKQRAIVDISFSSPSLSPSPSPRLVASPQLSPSPSPQPSHSSLQFTAASSQVTAAPVPRTLPAPYLSKTAFPLLDLPADVLSEVSSFLWVWDAFFLRCSCRTMRLISGLSGGATGPPITRAVAAATVVATQTVDLTGDGPPPLPAGSPSPDDDLPDEHRFWHHWTSIDVRQLLGGWRAFETERARITQGSFAHEDDDVVFLSQSPSQSPEGDGVALDFGEDVGVDLDRLTDEALVLHMRSVSYTRRGNGVPSSSSSSSATLPPAGTQPDWPIDPYMRLQNAVAPFLNGCPHLRPNACWNGSTSSGAAEDLATSEADDQWLQEFLTKHRLPFVQHLHLAYATLHASLLQHLQTFCCSSEGSGGGSVREVSVQYSEKSGGRWIDTVWKGFGRLEVAALDLSLCATRSIWPVLSRTLTAGAGGLTRLQLVGPSTLAMALPATILETLSTAAPLLRHLAVANGLHTTQAHLVNACGLIHAEKRWPHLRTLKLVRFMQIEHLLPLVRALEGRAGFKRLDLQSCLNARLPVLELPKKPPSASKNKRGESPPKVIAAPKISADQTIALKDAPVLQNVRSCTLAQCSSLTAPSLRALGVMFPSLSSLQLSGSESKLVGGTALKLLLDPTLFPALTTLHLAHCPHLDDHAWEALPKKTRMLSLRTMHLGISSSSSSSSSSATKRDAKQSKPTAIAIKDGQKFTDYGLKMLVVYCPSISSLNLSGHVHLTPGGLRLAFSQLAYLTHATLLHLPALDADWLLGIVRLPIEHALAIQATLTRGLIKSAASFLACKHAHAAASSSSASPAEPPLVLPANIASATPAGALLRSVLVQRLQAHMDALSQGRIRLALHC